MNLRWQSCIPLRLEYRSSATARLSLMLICIALNIAVILPETHTTKAKQVGFNQSVTRINFYEIRTNKSKNTYECVWGMEKLCPPRSTEEITAGVDQRTCCLGNLIPLALFFCVFFVNNSVNDWQWAIWVQYNLVFFFFNYTRVSHLSRPMNLLDVDLPGGRTSWLAQEQVINMQNKRQFMAEIISF